MYGLQANLTGSRVLVFGTVKGSEFELSIQKEIFKMALAGRICLVTGATRGIGRGIALQLGEAKATVYITGRTLKKKESGVPGSLEETAQEIEARGGRCIPVECDHSKDEDVERLFERINRENDGQLDVLVNNAYSAVTFISEAMKKRERFWEQPLSAWDEVNNVGLRNHYLCTVLASRMMVPRKKGLIVMISSAGGLRYLFNVAYGVGKAAVDRLAADCAVELKKHGVTCCSLWPFAVKTEMIQSISEAMEASPRDARMKVMFENGESTEYSGKCIVNLAADKNVFSKTGRILITGDLGDEYGFKDVDGSIPWNMRRLWVLLYNAGFVKTSQFIPGFLKVPTLLFALAGSKF